MGRWRGIGLAALLIAAGLVVTLIHDYAYRRGDSAGTGDYELGGLVSHAGTDLMILTVVLAAIAFMWANWRERSDSGA